MEELEQQPPEGLPAGSGHACNSLTREMLSRSLSGAQSRTLSKDSKHKRFSSVDFSSLHLDSSGSSSSGSAEEPLQSPSPTSPIPSEGSGSSHKAGSRLKRVSSRIWGKQPGTDWNAVVPSTSSASPSKSIKAATHGSHIMQSASAAVAHDILPKRVVQGWFSGLHSSGSDTPTASTSSLSPSNSSNFAQRFSSPLKAMSTASPRTNGHVQPTPTSTNRLFDRKWVDKAANYLFDTDANVDKCPDDIWVLGVLHAGYRDPDQQPTDPFAPAYPASSSLSNPVAKAAAKRRRKKQAKAAAADRSASLSPTVSQDSAASASTSSLATPQTLTPNSSQTLQRTADATPLPSLAQTAGWPPSFFLDFTSRIQLTYRNGFPPIVVPNEDFQTVLQHVPSAANGAASGASFRDFMGSLAGSIGRRGDADGLTSDAGWGCMLRTGQSLLANALSKYHLGRGSLSISIAPLTCPS